MARNVRLDDIISGNEDVDAAFRARREAIEGAHNWSVTGAAELVGTKDGYALNVKGVKVQVGKTGGSAIAAMSGSTPGSGTVTIYNFSGTTLTTTGATVTAFNMHPTETVSADAWVKLVDINGYPFVFWEPCA
jgi:hypothetical protein